jgi:hypothetical protein
MPTAHIAGVFIAVIANQLAGASGNIDMVYYRSSKVFVAISTGR